MRYLICLVSFFIISSVCYADGARPVPTRPKPYSVVITKLNDLTVQGALTKEQVTQILDQGISKFKYCYERKLQFEPNIRGNLLVKFTIDPTGKVPNPTDKVTDQDISDSTLKSQPVKFCVLGIIQRMTFPNTKSTSEIKAQFSFDTDPFPYLAPPDIYSKH